jgi:hypothetical protein
MTFRMEFGYPVVDAVWFGVDGMGGGVGGLMVDHRNGVVIEADTRIPLLQAGTTVLAGWGKCDGLCARINREQGVGYYAVPVEQWAKVEAWVTAG